MNPGSCVNPEAVWPNLYALFKPTRVYSCYFLLFLTLCALLRSVKASSQIQRTQDGAQQLQKKAAISEIA